MRSRAIVGADDSSAVPHIKATEKAHVLIKTVLVRNITQAPFSAALVTEMKRALNELIQRTAIKDVRQECRASMSRYFSNK
jgi:hypothetical protein